MKTIIRILIGFFASFAIASVGSANTALVTDANGSISFNDYSINLSNSFSIQSWSKAYDQTNYYSWNWMVGGSILGIGHVNGTIQGLVNNGSVGNAGAFTYNSWVHTVLTYDAVSQTYTLYKDGMPYSFSGAPNLGLVYALTLGGKNGNEYLNGELDEVAIWNKMLTSAEVAELYNAGAGRQANINSGSYISSSNLTLYFTFEDTLNPIIGVAGASTINGSAPSFTTINTLPITVTNTAPIVNQSHYFSIDENLPTGSHVGDIIATDNENDPLFYTLSGTDSSFFEINASGSVFALQPFDFETKNYYFFDVTVSDGNYSTATMVDVNINDMNETLPTNLVLSNVFTQTDLENAITSVADGGTIEITNPANILLDHQIIINKNITIMALANFVLDGNLSTGIMSIYPGFNATLIGLTMQNGYGVETAGAISNEGNLQLQKAIIRNNRSDMGFGGGVANLSSGTLIMSDCSIYDNNATSGGGGIYNSGSSMSIINSTISQNGALDGGGIYVDFGEANISHSTITRNVSGIGGVPNTATGGGLYNVAGTVNLKNTIIANNFDLFGIDNDCSGAGIFSLGFNAIGDCQIAYTPDDINGSFIKMTPIDTYYPMPIHKIYSSSQNAIVDIGSCTDVDGVAVDYDQLGILRPFGLGCDIGAVEYDSSMIIQNSDDGNAFEFNGVDDYALAPASTDLAFGLNQDFAISFWIKIAPTQNDTNSTLHTILTDYQYTQGMNVYTYFFGYDEINQTISVGRQDGFDDAPTLVSSSQLGDDSYHHVAYVKNGIDLFLYIDGVLEGTIQDTNIYGFNHLPAPIIAGSVPEMSSAYFTGAMDELSYWNRALTQNEILSNMYGTLMGDEANLVAYYKFDALTGAMIFDEKTLNDFTLYGSGSIGWVDSMAFGASTVSPSVAVNPTNIYFGDIPLYGYAEQNVTIENNSTVDLYINTIYLQYSDGIATLDTTGCSGSTLAPYTSCSVTVGVSPTYTGAYSNSVVIDTNSTLGLVYVPVSANGIDTNISSCTTDIAYCVDYTDCINAGWGTICESYFPTYDYPEMYTDETSCITAGYYWDGMYCTYYPQEVQIYSMPPSYYNIFSLGSFQFNAYNYINGDVTSIALWDSNDSSIAYVNSLGVMNAVSSGYVTISATYNNYTASQIVKIHDLSVYSDIVDGVYQYSDLNASDMKVYRIILSEPAILALSVTSPADPVVAVYDKNQTLLAYNDDYVSLDANLSVSLLEGEYFIGVTGYSAQALASYELTVDTSPIPFVSVFPSQISFGDIPLYGYAEQNITIENNSTTDLYLNNIYLEYYDGMTAFDSQCPLVLAPYANCSVSVGVSPMYTGAYANSVVIDTGVLQGLIYIPVSANGIDYNATTVYLTGISISPLNQEVEVGNSILFNAYANYSDNTSLDITNQAIWSAEYGTIVNGEYTTGNTIGDDFVTVAFEEFSLTIPVKVVDFNNTTIQDCTTDIAYCIGYTDCIDAGWGVAICESSFPTYDYPEMYTDEASCTTAGYYWNMTYCSYEPAESHISIEFGGNASEVDYTNALALDPSVLYGKSFYSLGFKDYILKSERMDIASSNWIVYGLDSALNYTKKTEELNTTTINNIMTSSKFDIKYLGSKDADSFNTVEFDIFTSNAKAYEFITARKVDEYLFHDLQINYDTQMPYGSFDEFITDRNGTAYFMNKKDSYDTGIAFNTADYSTGDRSGVIAEVTGAQVINSNIGSWSISFVEEVGSDVLFIYPSEEYKPYYYRAIFAINNDGELQRGEHQAVGDVYKFILFDAAGHNEFSDFIELGYNIAVPLDVQDVIIEPEEPVATISSLIISPLDINVTVSSSLQFSVSAKYSDDTILDVTDEVVWSALKGTISGSGLYTATDNEDIDTITATFEGFSVSATVRILPAAIEPEPEPEATFTVEVASGWNLMSLPTRAYMNLSDLIETFGVNAGKIDYLAKYDSIGWSYFLVDVHNETVDRFTSLSSNEGFWLKASTVFELKYTMPEDSSGADEVLPLSAGWNLVGFNSDKTPQMIKNLYAGYVIESIWIYKNGKWSVYIPDAAKNALVSTTIPRITNISKFDGVWINVK